MREREIRTMFSDTGDNDVLVVGPGNAKFEVVGTEFDETNPDHPVLNILVEPFHAEHHDEG